MRPLALMLSAWTDALAIHRIIAVIALVRKAYAARYSGVHLRK